VTEGVQSLHTRLQELEAKVAQIQINMWNILRILMAEDQLDLTWCLEDFLSSYGYLSYYCDTLLLSLLFWILVLYIVVFHTLFTICPFETKGGVFLIWNGIIFLTDQVNFVPE
jgi:hypothetical protein